MISIFRSYHPAVIFLLLVYTIFFRLILFKETVHLQPEQESEMMTGFLYETLNQLLVNRAWLFHITAIMVTFLQALYFNYIVNYYRILSKPSYLPALSYILISSLFSEFLYLTPALLANLFLLLAFSKMFSSYKKENALSIIFDAAFYISIASLIFFPYLVFIFFIIIPILIYRPFNLRELIIPFVGLLIPYYFLGVYFFWENRLNEFLHSLMISELRFSPDVLEKSIRILTESIPVLFVMVWSALFIQANLFKMVVQVRIYLMLFIIFFLIGIFSLAIHFNGEIDHFIWIIIPAGIAFALFFTEYKKRIVPEILHLFLILAILFFQYYKGIVL
ncbi:MAG: hypothetical protein H0W62_14595 [Chitinophagales bacterium]|nr:hypothetical protein [Chitinophagales bacterium]